MVALEICEAERLSLFAQFVPYIRNKTIFLNITSRGERKQFTLDSKKIKAMEFQFCEFGLPVINSRGEEELIEFKGEPFCIEFCTG